MWRQILNTTWFKFWAICLQSNHEHLFLQGEDKLYLSTEEAFPFVFKSNESNESAYLMNKQWQIVQIPHAYLKNNWPIRVISWTSI